MSEKNPTLPAIAFTKVGDPGSLAKQEGRWLVTNARGIAVGAMSAGYQPPPGMTLLQGEVHAIIRRRKADNAEEYHNRPRGEEWEVVAPEFVFAAQRT